MADRYVPADRSVLLDYISPMLIVSLSKSLKNRHFLVVLTISEFILIKILVILSTGLLVLESIPIKPKFWDWWLTKLGSCTRCSRYRDSRDSRGSSYSSRSRPSSRYFVRHALYRSLLIVLPLFQRLRRTRAQCLSLESYGLNRPTFPKIDRLQKSDTATNEDGSRVGLINEMTWRRKTQGVWT
jgi:hypothetical protein